MFYPDDPQIVHAKDNNQIAWIFRMIGALRRCFSDIDQVYTLYSLKIIIPFLPLTHLSLASHKRDIGKQCRPRSDAAKRGA